MNRSLQLLLNRDAVFPDGHRRHAAAGRRTRSCGSAAAAAARQPIVALSRRPGEISSIDVTNSISAGPEYARACSRAAPKSAVAATRQAPRPYARARATKSGLASAVRYRAPWITRLLMHRMFLGPVVDDQKHDPKIERCGRRELLRKTSESSRRRPRR